MKKIFSKSIESVLLDIQLYNELKVLGIIENKTQLSRLCGKNDSYVRCMRAKGYGLHIGSLVVLIFNLTKLKRVETDTVRLFKLSEAQKTIQEIINEKCYLKHNYINYNQEEESEK